MEELNLDPESYFNGPPNISGVSRKCGRKQMAADSHPYFLDPKSCPKKV